jgi:small multidrug resistance family-3 protein
MLEFVKVLGLFAITALAEILGCYLPWLVLTQQRSVWLLIPAAVSLGLFAWLLTLHPGAAGRIYAAYGGVYVAIALIWLWRIDGVVPTRWDLVGSAVSHGRYGDHHAPTGSVPFERQEAKMKIGELARLAGTNVETIRYYERDGLLPVPARSEGNYRIYGETHVQRLSLYSALSRSGHDAG